MNVHGRDADHSTIQQCRREVVVEDSGEEDEGGESDKMRRKGRASERGW